MEHEHETPELDQEFDPVFEEEQQHLTETYAKLQTMGRDLLAKMEANSKDAAADKLAMVDELSVNLASYADAMETYADFATVNRVIDAYNLAQTVDAEKLTSIQVLLKQPYFAKVVLQMKPGQEPKELYIGTAGIADENYRRLVVDWRSPVAEVYYNQENGPTSYEANGRTIRVDLKLRRQFDIEADRLNAYFDTTVAIQDAMLLASLSKRRTAQMQAITATIQKEQNQVIRHADAPTLLVNGIAGSASRICSTSSARASIPARCSSSRRTRCSSATLKACFPTWGSAIPNASRGMSSCEASCRPNGPADRRLRRWTRSSASTKRARRSRSTSMISRRSTATASAWSRLDKSSK